MRTYAELCEADAREEIREAVLRAEACAHAHPPILKAEASEFGVSFYLRVQPFPVCRHCGSAGVFIRTRHLESAEVDVFMCQTEGCEAHGLYFYGPERPVDNDPGF